MSSPPTVSVILVFHRDIPFLRPAVDSVLAQTFADFELLAVDNGLGVNREFFGAAAADPRLKIVSRPTNEGIPGGHNAGVAAARGRYVALLDYDDLMLPARLERQVAQLEADRSIDLVSSGVERIDAHGKVLGHEFTLAGAREAYRYSQYAAPFPTPALMGRREVFAEFPYRGVFPFSADFDFITRATERIRVGALNEVLTQYRWYAEQTTQSRRAALEQSRAAIRLATARRRAGRAEQLAGLQEWIAAGCPEAAASCNFAARAALRENFRPLAAYQARRMLAVSTTLRERAVALKLGSRAILRARPGEQRLTLRMFLRGPVRALAVHPV